MTADEWDAGAYMLAEYQQKEDNMSEQDWRAFFDALRQVADMPNQTWRDKRRAVEAAAVEMEAEAALEEFLGWWDE